MTRVKLGYKSPRLLWQNYEAMKDRCANRNHPLIDSTAPKSKEMGGPDRWYLSF